MPAQLESFISLIGVFPVETVYLLVALGAAVENIFPPIPSDTFVLLGGVLADQGIVRADLVFASAWLANILIALFVLVSRFFPVFRVVVPAFAGISRLGFWRTAVPLSVASALWYGILLFVGMFASRNLSKVLSTVSAFNAGLVVAALILLGGVGYLWWQSRRERRDPP
jgi:membrane protein DedA with SNARE-associated domain